ncbi:hypothetical protein P4V64_19360 [Bacillus thuringiensis]|nr:hypothetical protein [Bacillus thuringiensis]
MRDYYLLADDGRIAQKVVPSGLGLQKENTFEQLPPISVLDVNTDGGHTYTDWLEKPMPMISERMKTITAKYNPSVQWKRVDLIDSETNLRNVYWAMQVPAVDCLSMETAFHLNGTVKRLVLDTDKIKAHHFFKVQGILEPYIVVSLDAAESFLRRSLNGFVLQKVEQALRREL